VHAFNGNGSSAFAALPGARTDPSDRRFSVSSGVPTINYGSAFTVADIIVVPAGNPGAAPSTLQARLVSVAPNDATSTIAVYQTPNREAVVSAIISSQGDDRLFSVTVTADAAWAINSITFGGPYIYAPSSSDLKIFNAFQGGYVQDWRQDITTAQGTGAWPNMDYSPIGVFYNQATTEGVGFLCFDAGLEQRTLFWVSGPGEIHPYVRWDCMIAPGASQQTTVQMHHAFDMPGNQFTFYHDNFLKPFMDNLGIGEGTVNIANVMAWSDGAVGNVIAPKAAQAVNLGTNAYLQYAPGDGGPYFEPNPETLWWYSSLKDASQVPGLDVLGVLIDPFMRSRATSPTTDTTSPLWFPDGGGPQSLSDPNVQRFLNRLKNDLVSQGVNFAFWDLGTAAPAGEGKLWFDLLKSWKQAGISIAAESSCDVASYVTGTNLFFKFQETYSYDLVRAVTPKAKITVVDNRTTLANGNYWWNEASAMGFIPLLSLDQMALWAAQHPAP